MAVNLFDANYYRAVNPDLATFSDAKALSHFQNRGLDEGRTFSPFVDLKFYRSSNSDLANFSNRQSFDHLQKTGVNEGRTFSEFVDLGFYKANNRDLASFNNEQLFDHLRNAGLNEGRGFSGLVNLNFYQSRNSDLTGFSNRQLFEHLQRTGVNEGRTFSEFVDLGFYKANNRDLASFNNEQLFEHLRNSGVNEERRFSQFVDLKFYRESNQNIGSFGVSNFEALKHLQIYGLNEQRRFSQFFDINYYRANNSDLGSLGYNGRQLLQHFETYGLNEGRQFSTAFNTKYYQSVNPDLASLNNQQLYDHFQINGLGEGRISSPVFDVSYYLAKNSDLVARGLTYETAYNHFVLYGFQEGRIAQLPAYDIRTPETISGGSQFNSDLVPLGFRAPNRRVNFELIGDDNRRKIGSQTWVISHGWNGNLDQFRNLAGAVTRARPNDTVLVLDWTEAATTIGGAVGVVPGANYNYDAGTWIRPVAAFAQRALTRWGIDSSSLNFIGHSLGAYVSSETAGLFIEANKPPVKSITALDPASEANLRVINRAYDFDLSTAGIQGPRPFNAVGNFSRSFVGGTSIAGNPVTSGTANESIVLDFGLNVTFPGSEHGWVVDTFQRLIDPTPVNGSPLRLARNPLTPGGSPYLFSLDDYQAHGEFRQNVYAAGLIGGTVHEGRISITPPPNEFKFFVATKADNPNNKYVYGTTGNDQIVPGNSDYTNFNNSYFGDDGNDRIQGGTGIDEIYGGKGNDQLDGGSNRDFLDGVLDGDPNLAAFGLREIDTLTGGLGSDTFVLGNPLQKYYVGGGNDDYALITDFNPGGSNIAELAGIDFIQLNGRATDYRLAPSPIESLTGTAIYRSKPLDVFLLQDLSGSFTDDLTTVRSLVPDLVTKLQGNAPNIQFGVGSFVDKPISPFSDPFISGDYVYRTDLRLTANTNDFQLTVNGLSTRSQGDMPESQIEALLQTALRAGEIGFRDNAAHVVILSTDGRFHVAGDGSAAKILGTPIIVAPNNGDAILNGNPPGTGEDYPTLIQLRDALRNANIVPIFTVTPDQIDVYRSLVDFLGVGTVVELTSNSSNLVNAITTTLKNRGESDELIGIVQNVAGLDLNASYFTYV